MGLKNEFLTNVVENNIYEFDGFLENSHHLVTENLKIPNLEK